MKHSVQYSGDRDGNSWFGEQHEIDIELLMYGKDADVLAAVGYPDAVDRYQEHFRVPADASGTVTIQISAAWIPGNLVSIPVQ
jgi:hypothetical protein